MLESLSNNIFFFTEHLRWLLIIIFPDLLFTTLGTTAYLRDSSFEFSERRIVFVSLLNHNFPIVIMFCFYILSLFWLYVKNSRLNMLITAVMLHGPKFTENPRKGYLVQSVWGNISCWNAVLLAFTSIEVVPRIAMLVYTSVILTKKRFNPVIPSKHRT